MLVYLKLIDSRTAGPIFYCDSSKHLVPINQDNNLTWPVGVNQETSRRGLLYSFRKKMLRDAYVICTERRKKIDRKVDKYLS